MPFTSCAHVGLVLGLLLTTSLTASACSKALLQYYRIDVLHTKETRLNNDNGSALRVGLYTMGLDPDNDRYRHHS